MDRASLKNNLWSHLREILITNMTITIKTIITGQLIKTVIIDTGKFIPGEVRL